MYIYTSGSMFNTIEQNSTLTLSIDMFNTIVQNYSTHVVFSQSVEPNKF